MKTLLLSITLLLISTMAFSQASAGDKKTLRHVVLFKFKDGSSAEDIKKVEEAFRNLPKKIKEIKGYEWGTFPHFRFRRRSCGLPPSSGSQSFWKSSRTTS
jgi:hypothetical protein